MIKYYLLSNNEMCCSTKIQTFHQLNTPLHRWSFEHTQERGPGDPEFLRGLLGAWK